MLKKQDCKGGINIEESYAMAKHKTDGTPCWCNPKIIKVKKTWTRKQNNKS